MTILARITIRARSLPRIMAAWAEETSFRIARTVIAETSNIDEPGRQIIPLMALARATAALATHFGDPAFIDLVAEVARRLQHDSTIDLDAVLKELKP